MPAPKTRGHLNPRTVEGKLHSALHAARRTPRHPTSKARRAMTNPAPVVHLNPRLSVERWPGRGAQLRGQNSFRPHLTSTAVSSAAMANPTT